MKQPDELHEQLLALAKDAEEAAADARGNKFAHYNGLATAYKNAARLIKDSE